MSLTVLITNFYVSSRSGTELYVRDLALELKRQGHTPAVYSPWLGKLAKDLVDTGITTTDSLKQLDFAPDIIHGHHRFETLAAIRRFPGVPAIYICHDYASPRDIPPHHPSIVHYYGISKLCMERVRKFGIPADKIGLVYNFADLERFKQRPPLPSKPKRALVFSNYAKKDNYLPAIEKACKIAGLELNVIGKESGHPTAYPENALVESDIVFAVGKSAIEAMAVGCALVLCNFGGLGPMVTAGDFDRLRDLNFGLQALTEKHTPEAILRKIQQYNAEDATRVCELLRMKASLKGATAELVDAYTQAIETYTPTTHTYNANDLLNDVRLARYRASVRLKKMRKRFLEIGSKRK